ILMAFLSALAAVSAVPTGASTSSTCVTAIGIPSLDNINCLPLKAEDISLNPSPKFLFSANNYCASFDRKFASITVLRDSVPAGKTCTLFTFTDPGCTGTSKESSSSSGCIRISTLPSQQSA
ncbi:MAG: hypothetical protein Q9224_004769, partial [Gallowayella concinna]